MGVPTAHYKAPHARPSLSVATHDRQPFYDLVPRDPERQVPLTNNTQIRVALGESTSNSKAGRALESVSTVWTSSGYPPLARTGSLASRFGPTGYTIPMARFVLNPLAADQLCMRFSNGKISLGHH